jgi:aspartate racemase
MMKKCIGILGGISPASTLEYYRSILSMYYDRNHDYFYPEIVIRSVNFGLFADLEAQDDNDGLANYLGSGIHSLAAAGADFAIMACNSAHSVFEQVSMSSPIPMISIIDSAAKEASRLGLGKLLLTGIKYTMQRDFYQKGMSKSGIQVVVPSERQQDEINRIVFEELSLGKFLNESREKLLEIVDDYDVDGIILGCTELPLLIGDASYRKPLLDTLHLHAKAALDYCLE